MDDLYGDADDGTDWAWVRLGRDPAGCIAEVAGEGPGVDRLRGALPGLTLLEAAAVRAEPLAADALAAAVGPAVSAAATERRIAVAMSGGVDSAVALLHALREGLDPVGVTLRLWIDPAASDGARACCAPSSVRSARDLCHDLGVPHVTLDLRDDFRQTVVRHFVESYASGETPNPCVRCNADFRFDALLALADRIGARRVATGHYARLAEHAGRLLVARGRDADKDQSYMLGRLDPSLLGRLWFPLGDQTKATSRDEARAAGLEAAGRRESQEACFLGGDDYREFLARHGLPGRDGPVVDRSGAVLGSHRGFWGFTPGQRRGLRIASRQGALYTIATDPGENSVVVGPRQALARTRVVAEEGRLYVPARRVAARLRHRSTGVPATVSQTGGGFSLELDEPAMGIARGQVAVLYGADVVVGAGVITAAE